MMAIYDMEGRGVMDLNSAPLLLCLPACRISPVHLTIRCKLPMDLTGTRKGVVDDSHVAVECLCWRIC